MKEYAAGKTTLDPWLGVKVSMKSGAGRLVAGLLCEPVVDGHVAVHSHSSHHEGEERRDRRRARTGGVLCLTSGVGSVSESLLLTC